jgi:2,3-diketo-5-methylthiopentyl-1-phosphate enolase
VADAGREEILATYLAVLPAGAEAAAAEAFAVGQTIGTWTPVPGITEAMRQAFGGRVVEVREGGDDELVAGEAAAGSSVLRVAFPVANVGDDLPMLFTMLLGNDPSTSLAVRLVDLELSESWRARYAGPRHGIDGWRRLTGVHGRPLLLNMIKPCTGFPPAVGAEFVRAVAEGGHDLIKDDELLASPGFSPVGERAQAYAQVLDDVSQVTGQRPRYIANITSRASDLASNADAALEGGADALMVNVLAVGLDALAGIVDAGFGVPIFAHTAGVETLTGSARAGFGHALLIGHLVRQVGADATLTSTPFASRPMPEPVFQASIRAMREVRGDVLPAMPVLGGGLTADHVAGIVEAVGNEVIVGVGGAIQGHRDGPAAGARAVLLALRASADASGTIGAPEMARGG